MPALVWNKQLIIGAAWARPAGDGETLGAEISDQVLRIHDFLKAQF